jgi:hypothetical protein
MEIKKYNPGDEKYILELFKLSFGKEMTQEYWDWRFKSNPFNQVPMIHLMWDDEKLVGHYAVSPIEMVIDGKIHKTALSMTTMTHPEYGGRGIFSQLADSLYNELKDEHGYTMVWGFPNNNSHYGFIKNLNWYNIADVPFLALDAEKLKKVDLHPYKLHDSFSKEISDLLSDGSKKIKINKTTDYLTWRYIDNPSANYQILTLDGEEAVIVYKVFYSDSGANEVDILEINFNNNLELLLKLLNAVVSEVNSSIVKFNIWHSLFSDGYIVLEKCNFMHQAPLTYMGAVSFDDNKSVIGDYRNWDIGFGYSDVF